MICVGMKVEMAIVFRGELEVMKIRLQWMKNQTAACKESGTN